MPRPINYDLIAQLYDEAVRNHVVDPNLVSFFLENPEISQGNARILDVGCGTGKQLAAIIDKFPRAFSVGLDRFSGMLSIAHQRCPKGRWVHGDGAALPFGSKQFYFVCNQFSYHHVPDKRQLLSEIFRVLRPGGRFAMMNIDPWSMEDWDIYQFFPEARALDNEDFLPADDFMALMEQVGFVKITVSRNTFHVSEELEAFLVFAKQRHRISQFMALTDAAYRRGIARIERALVAAKDVHPTIESGMCLVTVVGDKHRAQQL